MIVRAGLTGPFPRSEALVTATRDFDRGRTSADSLEALFARTEGEVVALEHRLGFDETTAGYLRWPDLFRPFAETWEGFTVGPLTRWLETNTFYRQPILLAPPGRTPGAIASRLPPPLHGASAKARVLLPGPYSFAVMLDNRSGETESALIHRLGRLLGEEVKELHGRGFTTFLFSEPQLVVRPPEGPRAEAVVAGYRAIEAALNGGTSIVWTYGADARPTFPLLDRLPVSAVGFDLAETVSTTFPPVPRASGSGSGSSTHARPSKRTPRRSRAWSGPPTLADPHPPSGSARAARSTFSRGNRPYASSRSFRPSVGP
ncbi:MAG: hypothetical protein ACLP8Y_07535 [Thermoplasmata archaeon]